MGIAGKGVALLLCIKLGGKADVVEEASLLEFAFVLALVAGGEVTIEVGPCVGAAVLVCGA